MTEHCAIRQSDRMLDISKLEARAEEIKRMPMMQKATAAPILMDEMIAVMRQHAEALTYIMAMQDADE